MATKNSIFSYKSRCECNNPTATWRIWNKIRWISILSDVVGNVVFHYFFLINKLFECFFILGWFALGRCVTDFRKNGGEGVGGVPYTPNSVSSPEMRLGIKFVFKENINQLVLLPCGDIFSVCCWYILSLH